MRQGRKISLCLLSLCLVLHLCSTQSGTFTLDCATYMKSGGGQIQCGNCKTAKMVLNSDGSNTYSCSECNSGYSSGEKTYKKGDPAPTSFNFGDYCSILPSWGWYAIFGVAVVGISVALFLLRDKLPCSKKRKGY